MKGNTCVRNYLQFVLRSCAAAETDILRIHPETPDGEETIRARVKQLKTNWGKGSASPCVLITGRDCGIGSYGARVRPQRKRNE
jgi:hypothetical protein